MLQGRYPREDLRLSKLLTCETVSNGHDNDTEEHFADASEYTNQVDDVQYMFDHHTKPDDAS